MQHVCIFMQCEYAGVLCIIMHVTVLTFIVIVVTYDGDNCADCACVMFASYRTVCYSVCMDREEECAPVPQHRQHGAVAYTATGRLSDVQPEAFLLESIVGGRYSDLNAPTGLIFVTRRAGIQDAASATIPRTTGTPTNVSGSSAGTP